MIRSTMCVMALAAAGGAARAQLTVATTAGFARTAVGAFGNPATPYTLVPGSLTDPVAAVTSTTASATLTLKDDYSVLVPNSTAGLILRSIAVVDLTVGTLPVEISSLRLSWNFKTANTGGGANNGMSSLAGVTGVIKENTGAETPVLRLPSFDLRNGNGSWVEGPNSSTYSAPYVLAAGTSYFLQIIADFAILDDAATGPQRGHTLEAGGGLSQYDGYAATINFRTVPAPGAAVALMFGGAALGARRRRG